MNKPVIAVDVDDVLSATAEGFIAFSNRHFGTTLTVEDYHDDWSIVWKVDGPEVEQRAHHYHATDTRDNYLDKKGAKAVLKELKHYYKLIVITSRRAVLQAPTLSWLEARFPGVFEEVYFSGIYDAGLANGRAVQQTKNELLSHQGVSFLIDDQFKHCAAAAEVGVEAVLFGGYNWNKAKTLPKGVTRCLDWAAVGRYFDGRS